MFQNFLQEKKKYLLFLLLIFLIVIFFSKKRESNFFSSTNNIALFITDLKNYFNLKKENKELNKENIRLLNDNRSLREVENENVRLREMLGITKRSNLKLQLASVIGRDPTNFFNILILDKGFENSVKKDMAVINNYGVIGKVILSGQKSSKVILLIDSNCNISAIDTRSRVYGVVSGTGSSICVMKFVSSQDDVKVGDTIISSGEGEIFPKGFLIGRVIKVEKTKDELMLDIYVKPAANLSILEEVFVVIK